MEKINGIIKDGRVYKISDGGCFKCDFFNNTLAGSCPVKELCTTMHIASYWNGEWYSNDDEFTRNPQMWMPIPPIPDTNTDKK